MKGCYVFKTPNNLIFILPINQISISKLKFVIKESKEARFYYFFGLDYQEEEPELENQLLNYFRKDIISYPILDIHPCLQGKNYENIKRFPKLFKRINELKVYYDERSFEEIAKNKLKF